MGRVVCGTADLRNSVVSKKFSVHTSLLSLPSCRVVEENKDRSNERQ